MSIEGSTNRVTPERGFGKSPGKGPNGRGLCRWCGKEVPKGRYTFCSKDCVHEHRIRSDPGYVRSQLLKRDGGKCALCGLETEAIIGRLDAIYWRLNERKGRDAARAQVAAIMKRLGLERPGGRYSYWDADHVVPVVEGGGECGLDNYRTLCIWCHRKETAKLAGRRRKAKQTG